ncbi:MAG: L,D-transpeptidase [Chloroflexaceae bacterium]|nr:L,D-transpeptidase [Chloroflexaceae bacterium]
MASTQPPPADFAVPLTPVQATTRIITTRMAHAGFIQGLRQSSNIDPIELPYVPTVYFPVTGHHLSNRSGFLDFWRANGQLLIFGYPLTEEFIENGRIVQYFERVRFEFNPQSGQVELGLLGHDVTMDYWIEPVGDPQDGSRYFAETMHTLNGVFLRYWERHGGLAVFGYPITEPMQEHGHMVQYFERARFQYEHDQPAETLYEIRLGDLGRQVTQLRGIDTSPVIQMVGAANWTPGLWSRRVEVNLSTQWLTAYEADLPVYYAPVATGRDGFNTPTGTYAIYEKLPSQTMAGSAGGESWYVPNVPWVMYVVGGVALHGTYWHNVFGTGTRMSHGCINLRMDDAQWLYEWADIGTTVVIHY